MLLCPSNFLRRLSYLYDQSDPSVTLWSSETIRVYSLSQDRTFNDGFVLKPDA